MSGRLIVISAPSGTGKTSVIAHFLSTHPEMIHSVSCTTRKIRGGETDGVDYHFISEKKFRRWVDEGAFVEWAEVHTHLYGTLKKDLDLFLKEGKEVLLDLDVQGGMNLKRLYGERALSIFLMPPSMEELKRRLALRGTDSQEQLEVRLKNAEYEMRQKDRYDVTVVNTDLNKACLEIECEIKKVL